MDQKALYSLTYGLFVVGVEENGWHGGCIVNTVIQQSSKPLFVSVTINKDNYTHDVLRRTKKITVSVLDESAPFDLFKRFGFQSGRDALKWDDLEDKALSKNGTYHLTNHAAAYLSGRIVNMIDFATHTMFVIEVDDAQRLSKVPAVTYGYYRENIKPKAENKSDRLTWVCTVCGYVYVGEEIPEDFVCPVCKHPASDFAPMKPKDS